MLIDHIVNFCDGMHKLHVDGNPCDECNHPTGCQGDCKNCLDEVHWMKPEGRFDYDCDHLLYFYTCRYSHKYTSEIIYALKEIDLDNYPSYEILSLGCGAAPDLMAFDWLNQRDKKSIRYRGYDRNFLWKSIHDEIENHMTLEHDDVDATFKQKDVFDVLLKGKPRRNYNVLVMEYLLSHLYNTQQISDINDLYDRIIDNVIAYKRNDSPFLIIINDIDSHHKGRNYFWPFQKKLKAAGYHGTVLARCFKQKVYLQGAEKYPHDYNMFSIPDHIKDSYKCAIECTSAQLIIEVR